MIPWPDVRVGVSIFAVDGTLVKIAKRQRIFGLDNLYLSNSDDDTITEIFLDGKRVFLTKDRNFTEDRVNQATTPFYNLILEMSWIACCDVVKNTFSFAI